LQLLDPAAIRLCLDVKYLQTGLKLRLEEQLVKFSPTLNRDAQYSKISKIARLPAYLSINFIRFFYKEMFALSFDKEYAKVSGVNGKFIQIIFMVIVGLVIGASMRIVGILLVSSLMTIPVAAAIQLAKSFKGALVYSIVIGELSVIIGLFAAFHLDIAPGGTIVITSIVILLLVLGWARMKGKQPSRKEKGEFA